MIENNEIFLTKLSQKDQSFYCEIYTDEALLKYIVSPLSVGEARKSFTITLRKMLVNPPELMLYTVNSKQHDSKQHDNKLGIIGIKWNLEERSHVELGVIIIKKYQRQGIAYKAKIRIIQQVFENLKVNKIIAFCDNNNNAANPAI